MGNDSVELLPHGLDERVPEVEYQGIFPSKSINCFLSGRPIANSTPDSRFTRFLETNDCAIAIKEESVEAVQDAILELRNNAPRCAPLVENALKVAARHQFKTVAKTLRS